MGGIHTNSDLLDTMVFERNIMKRQVDNETRQWIFERDQHTCRYCGNREGPFNADHVYPYAKGGETSTDNLVTACGSCNRKKQAKVGLWPMPIGYFDVQRSSYSLFDVIVISNAVVALMILGAILSR